MPVDAMDEALEMLEGKGPEYADGFSNHGPMAADALHALGRDADLLEWVESYRTRLSSTLGSGASLTHFDWRESLGRYDLFLEWVAFFNRELDAPWRTVLDRWVPRLAPGFIAAAAHGILRTAHAARSLAESEGALRLRELAQGLAYWAARYQALAEGAPTGGVGRRPNEAIETVEFLPLERRARGGPITSGLEALSGLESFSTVIHRADLDGEVSRVLSDLTETFARVYVANPGRNFIALLHGVTGASAIRLLTPHVSEEVTRSLLRYGWQAGAGLYAAYASRSRPEASDPAGDVRETEEELAHRAVATGDEHAIKLTEACLREHALNPQPEYFAAARHVVDLMG